MGRALHSHADEREPRAHFALHEMGVIEGEDKNGEPSLANSFYAAIRKNVFSIKAAGTKDSISTPANLMTTNSSTKNSTPKSNAGSPGAMQRTSSVHATRLRMFRRCRSDGARSVSIAEWMNQRGLTSPRLRWWVEYACRDDYGMTLEQTSAWAGLFYFCSRVATPGG